MKKAFTSFASALFEKSLLNLMKKKLTANTSAIFAIFEPKAFPIAIFELLPKLARIAIKISGEDVARPINMSEEKKYEIFKSWEIFSVYLTRIFAL